MNHLWINFRLITTFTLVLLLGIPCSYAQVYLHAAVHLAITQNSQKPWNHKQAKVDDYDDFSDSDSEGNSVGEVAVGENKKVNVKNEKKKKKKSLKKSIQQAIQTVLSLKGNGSDDKDCD